MIRGKFLLTGDPASQYVYAIRQNVFVDELGMDAQPIDEHDVMSVYALVLDDEDIPSATGRLYIEGDKFRIGKVCVLKNARRRYMGDLVMRMLLYRAQELNCSSVSLSAPLNTVSFFARYGLAPQGEVYEENGVFYREMYAEKDEISLEGSCSKGGACGSCHGNCDACANAECVR